MIKTLLLIASLAVTSFAATLPRPAGEVPYEVPDKGKQLISQYRGKVVLLAGVLTT